MNQQSLYEPAIEADKAEVAANWILVALVGIVIAGASLSVLATSEPQAGASANLIVPKGITAL